ncbi:response regulator [Taibaiella koreensis]|uniref:response regulator n=1 Tax=Taibaiella koreensis TaxID=1268548 RepID=UPI000E5A0CF3|nr:response regulator transcription factor [Taibaiella koreensis]
MPIRIAIADDHHLISEGIANMLRYSADIELVGAFPDGPALFEGLELVQPDVLLLDIQMPGMQGDEIAAVLKRCFPRLKIIALTSFDTLFHIRRMMQQGIEGYLLKHIRRESLVEAITLVFGGGTYLDEAVSKLIDEDDQLQRRQKAMGTLLTKREKEILVLIAANHTSSEIAVQLFISKRTVEHHRESIFAKLEVKKVSALVQKAVQLGLIEG